MILPCALESHKPIFVDVKNRDFHYVNNQLFLLLNTSKLNSRYLELERTFQIPVWFAFIDHRSEGKWLWIGIQKAIKTGRCLKDKNGSEFLSVNIKEFSQVSDQNTLETLLK